MPTTRREFGSVVAALTGLAWRRTPAHAASKEVIVYTALDQEFSEPLFKPFEQSTGIDVLPRFDTEATKTVGLANTIRAQAEAGRIRCDLFWNNEILNTLRLKQAGLLRPIDPPHGRAYPAQFRAGDNTWFGFAARARVLIVNKKILRGSAPRSIFDLKDKRFKDQVGIAKPLFGTTATHAACLFAKLGASDAKQLFLDFKRNGIRVLSGNKQVALNVSSGSLAMGLTDTDDAIIELEKGLPVQIVYLDAAPDELGTLFIPNTVAALVRSPNPAEAERLANYLLSPEVETALARGPSAQIPLNPAVTIAARIETPRTTHAMAVDWNEAANRWNETARFIAEEFTAP